MNVKKKSKNILLKLIFSHTMIDLLLLLLQMAVLFSVYQWLSDHMASLWVGYTFLTVLVVIFIINANENPDIKLTWMIPICAIPIFGVMTYILVKSNLGTRQMNKRLSHAKESSKELLRPNHAVVEAMKQSKEPILDISYYLQNIGNMPTYANTSASYFSSGEEMLQDLIIELENAKEFIFLEYYIIERGVVWNQILEILERKVKQGVEVRVMYDGMCMLYKLPYRYVKTLQKMGIQAKIFSPIVPLLSTHQNNRDHRKILVIDGRISYCGGINLADEYMNEIQLFGHWKDNAIKLSGDAVKSFTVMFLQMWDITEQKTEEYGKYIHESYETKINKELGYVIPYNDDPLNHEDIAEDVYMDMLSKAKRYVHIMTPYLVIDYEMANAIMFAAKRGVDVKLMIPHIPDKKVIYDIARTYYPDFLSAGVKIYEYEPGFVHAKTFVADDERAVVGTINLDFRSLFEHFECATFIYKNPVIGAIEKDYQETLKKCIEVTPEYYKNIPIHKRIVGRIFKVFGSLM